MSGHSKWSNIKHRKGKNDALKAKITTKISREITVAVKAGGTDPTGNMRLKLALQKARENNIPKDNIQRAIDKGAGAGDVNNYEEITYEGYGPGGAAILVDVMTDNRNRAAADVRHAFSKRGGNLGESGSVNWMFKRKGVFVIYTLPEDYDAVESALAEASIATDMAQITMVPDTNMELTGDDAVNMQRVLDMLEDLDDVQDVYHNAIMDVEE